MVVMNIRITILPKTPLGWLSVGLVIAVIVLFGVVESLLGTEVSKPIEVASAIVFAGISGAAVVAGLIGIIRRRERSALVFLTTAIGLFALIIAIGQAFGKTIGW